MVVRPSVTAAFVSFRLHITSVCVGGMHFVLAASVLSLTTPLLRPHRSPLPPQARSVTCAPTTISATRRSRAVRASRATAPTTWTRRGRATATRAPASVSSVCSTRPASPASAAPTASTETPWRGPVRVSRGGGGEAVPVGARLEGPFGVSEGCQKGGLAKIWSVDGRLYFWTLRQCDRVPCSTHRAARAAVNN